MDDGSQTLVMPWSGEDLAFVDEARQGGTSRPVRGNVSACTRRAGHVKLDMFSTRVTTFEVRDGTIVRAHEVLELP